MKLRLPRLNTPVKLGMFLLCLKVCLHCSAILYPGAIMDALLSFGGSACLFLAICARRCTPKTALLQTALLLTALYTAWTAKNLTILIAVLSGMAVCREKTDVLLDILWKTELSFLAVQLFSAGFRKVVSAAVPKPLLSGGTACDPFGFTHPNLLPLFLSSLLLIWCCRHYVQLRAPHYIGILAAGSCIVLLAKAKTPLLAEMLFILLLLRQKKRRQRKNRLLSAAAAVLPVALCLLTVITTSFYTRSSLLMQLEDWLGTRLIQAAHTYAPHSTELFDRALAGSAVWQDPARLRNTLPTGGTNALFTIRLGGVWLIILLACALWMGLRGPKRALPFFILWAFYSFTEVNALNAWLLFPVLLPVLTTPSQKISAPMRCRRPSRPKHMHPLPFQPKKCGIMPYFKRKKP